MQLTPPSASKIVHLTVALNVADMAKLLDVQKCAIVQLRRQVAWFQRQIFGHKSERRLPQPEGVQGLLGESFEIVPTDLSDPKKSRIAAHEREQKGKNNSGNQIDSGDESALFFDNTKVPVEVIARPNPDAAGLDPADFEVIGEKVSDRLAQRPGSYVILKYVRRVIKVRTTQTPSCPPAPVGVINGCRADVSFIAGMIIGKFAYHQPLYRQHVKLRDAGINVSHAWLTKLMPAAVSMLEPIFNAQLDFVRRSRVIAMDETPIKAGRAGPGKMKAAYFWPVVDEQDEICFLYYPSRAAKHVDDAIGLNRPKAAVLQSDGYSAYARYAKRTGITHAQCWAHAHRKIYDARDIEPVPADQALGAIAGLYKVEQAIRNEALTGHAKYARRQEQAKPILDRLFAWIDEQFDKQRFLPSSPFLGALAYIRGRRVGLSVYLDDPEVSIDTNHVGIVQSLLATCRLHDINPFDYFVDVLQRFGQHPASFANQLRPRIWTQMFAANPLRSELNKRAGLPFRSTT